MMEPLPSSPIAPASTTTPGPDPHWTVAVAPMRTAIMTTAGLARNTADWSSASVAAPDSTGPPPARSPTAAPTSTTFAVLDICSLPDAGFLPSRHRDPVPDLAGQERPGVLEELAEGRLGLEEQV